jgi:hypothetical protein
MNDAQNIDKLTRVELGLLAMLFTLPTGLGICHCIEVRLDDPAHHMLYDGPGIVHHGGNDSRNYAKHYDDDEWAVVRYDAPAWLAMDQEALIEKAMTYVEGLE